MKAKCTGHRADGERCGRWPTNGATVCKKHGAGAPQVAAKAAVRAEIERWGLGDADVDPGQTLLKLISQSAARAQRYAEELEQLVAESPNLRDALIGNSYGEFGKVGEYVRGLVRLESEERDRLARFCGIATNAGLMERQVAAAEKLGGQLAIVIQAVLGDQILSLSAEQQAAFPGAVRRHLALAGAPAVAGPAQNA